MSIPLLKLSCIAVIVAPWVPIVSLRGWVGLGPLDARVLRSSHWERSGLMKDHL